MLYSSYNKILSLYERCISITLSSNTIYIDDICLSLYEKDCAQSTNIIVIQDIVYNDN